LIGAALGQGPVASGALDIVICAVFERVTSKYGQRGLQYVHIEARHAVQNIHLQAAALSFFEIDLSSIIDIILIVFQIP